MDNWIHDREDTDRLFSGSKDPQRDSRVPDREVGATVWEKGPRLWTTLKPFSIGTDKWVLGREKESPNVLLSFPPVSHERTQTSPSEQVHLLISDGVTVETLNPF